MPSRPPIRAPVKRRLALCTVWPTLSSEMRKQVTMQVWMPGQFARFLIA